MPIVTPKEPPCWSNLFIKNHGKGGIHHLPSSEQKRRHHEFEIAGLANFVTNTMFGSHVVYLASWNRCAWSLCYDLYYDVLVQYPSLLCWSIYRDVFCWYLTNLFTICWNKVLLVCVELRVMVWYWMMPSWVTWIKDLVYEVFMHALHSTHDSKDEAWSL